jgi:hypothetical protein
MFPDLYNICNEQTITVAGAAAMSWIFPSRRWLTPDLILQEATADESNKFIPVKRYSTLEMV